jgi:imidazolonepropionase-like amidohydrolase
MEHARADFVRWSRKGFSERASADAETRARWSGSYRARELAVRAFADAGVGLLASASGGWFLVPGFSLHAELECLAGAGLTPAEILTAATANAARSVGKENEWGSVREGLAADLVLLDANPFEDVRNALRIAAVVRRGELYDRAALDRLLAVADAER